MTPHINAKKGEIAKTVLMPGDPLRAKFIAENFLTNVKLVSSVRNILMYTGEFKGKKISIAASGMGAPSIGIYSFELFKFYGVEQIVRIGSAGSYKKEIDLYDLFLADEAFTYNESFSELVLGEKSKISRPSKELNEKILKIAQDKKYKIHIGRIHSSDVFYTSRSITTIIEETNSLVVEMEAAALFVNAKKFNKKAAVLLTVSDNLITKQKISTEQRQNSFTKMIEIALELAE